MCFSSVMCVRCEMKVLQSEPKQTNKQMRVQLLREWWEHAEVSKVFNVVVGCSLCWVTRHRQHVLEDLCLAGLCVWMRVSSLLTVMLTLPLRPDLRRTTLELTTALTALTRHIESSVAIGEVGVGVSGGRGGGGARQRAVG